MYHILVLLVPASGSSIFYNCHAIFAAIVSLEGKISSTTNLVLVVGFEVPRH
jgi:hypothetical protein